MVMPGFFKDAPERLTEVGEYKITVYNVFFHKETISSQETYKGKKWIAYLKVRLASLKKDFSSIGSYSGVDWSLEKLEE